MFRASAHGGSSRGPVVILRATGSNPPGGQRHYPLISLGQLRELARTLARSFTAEVGVSPEGGLVQGTDGNFYGTTSSGGSSNQGTIFRLSMGLPSFIKTIPTFGKPGAAITILGTDLTGAVAPLPRGSKSAHICTQNGYSKKPDTQQTQSARRQQGHRKKAFEVKPFAHETARWIAVGCISRHQA